MKKIGIVGGVAWTSTVEYYRLICQWANAHHKAAGARPPYPTPRMTIESLNMAETRALRGSLAGGEESWAAFDAVFRDAFMRLATAGCDVALMANNTTHTRLHTIRKGVPIPIISIIEETAKAAARTGATRTLVLGTSVTMSNTHYGEALAAHGIEANDLFPDEVVQEMQRLIDTEFYSGATSAGRKALLDFCSAHDGTRSDTVVLLACTELPLAFPDHLDDTEFEAHGCRFVNTTAVHAAAAFRAALEI